MTLWLNDFKSFIRERRLTLRIVLLIFILLYLFANAFIIISKEYPLKTNSTNNFNTRNNFSFSTYLSNKPLYFMDNFTKSL